MIEVNAIFFWIVCAMAAVGFIQAVVLILKPEEKQDWTASKYSPPGAAPDGFRWVLIKDE